MAACRSRWQRHRRHHRVRQNALGDVVYVQLPELQRYAKGSEAATVESVKAASGVYMPWTGKCSEPTPHSKSTPNRSTRHH